MRRILAIWLWIEPSLAVAAPGDVDSSFTRGADASVTSVAIQPDGKIFLGGNFSLIGGVARNSAARLESNGAVDLAFNPNIQSGVATSALLKDGRILLGGVFFTVNFLQHNDIARLNPDGSLDSGFAINHVYDYMYASLVQPDGKVVIGGRFDTVVFNSSYITRYCLARLNADGTLDSTFDPNGGRRNFSPVYTLAQQSDGKIVVGGSFAFLGNTSSLTGLARLNSDGTVDNTFLVNLSGGSSAATVYSLIVQPDGKILVGGSFVAINGTPCNNLARLNADGTLDTSFNPDVDSEVNGMALQADGQIIIGGHFGNVGGVGRNFIARLSSAGALDNTFNPNAGSTVLGMALQADGKIVMGGNFTTVGAVGRGYLARLLNGPASQSLTVPSANRVQWLRGGSSPEAQDVSFELSTNNGGTWTSLGNGTRIIGGWELTGLSLPASGHIRACARTTGGQGNGSNGLLDTVVAFGEAVSSPEIAVEQPFGTNLSDGGSKNFGTVSTGTSASLTFGIRNTGTADLTGLSVTVDGANASEFAVTSTPTTSLTGPDGATSFTIAFTPIAPGARTASVHIASNDADESPFDITLTGTATTPEIAVEQPAGSDILNGGTKDMGSVVVESNMSKDFTIRNKGNADLTGLTMTIDGPNASDFKIYATPVSPLSPGAVSGLSVGFTPGNTGPRSAVIHIASNDLDENPFNLALIGTGVPSSNPDLAALYPGAGTLSPGFNSATTNYLMNVNYSVTSIAFTPTAAQSFASIVINGIPTIGGSPGSPIALNVGTNVISLVVTAQDGIAKKIYTVTVTRSAPSAADVDASFDARPGGTVYALATQPNGKILLGGLMTDMGGIFQHYCARLNTDGSLDPFNPNPTGWLNNIAAQPSGDVLLGGIFYSVGGSSQNGLARVSSIGTPDTGFNPTLGNGYTYCLVPQPDDKILFSGIFSTVNGASRSGIARVNADGTLDTSFAPTVSGGAAYCLALQPDGKIVMAGGFTTVAGVSRNYLARLNNNGTLDTTFVPSLNNYADCVAVQPDGKLLIAGGFSSVNSVARNYLVRLNQDGTIDPGFVSNLDNTIYSIALQTDGKIVLGGTFRSADSSSHHYLARLNSDGSVDTSFTPDFDGTVLGVQLQTDGKVLAAGSFLSASGLQRSYLARLNNDPATQSLTVKSSSRVQWMRGGSSPEAQSVAFELSTNSGASWSALGNGLRIAGGWELTSLSLPASGQIRARARTVGGYYNGSAGLVQTITTFPTAPDIAVEEPAGNDLVSGLSSRDFGSTSVNASSVTKTFTLRNSGNAALGSISLSIDGTNAADFTAGSPATTSLASGATTTFNVSFLPHATGARRATLHIVNDDPDEASFDITLAGTGASPTLYQQWAQTNGVSYNPSSSGANSIANLENFGFGLSPIAGGLGALNFNGNFANGGTIGVRGQPTLRMEGSDTRVLFMRRKDFAAAGLTYSVQFTGDLLNWQTSAAVPTVLADDGVYQIVTVPYPVGLTSGGFFKVSLSMQ